MKKMFLIVISLFALAVTADAQIVTQDVQFHEDGQFTFSEGVEPLGIIATPGGEAYFQLYGDTSNIDSLLPTGYSYTVKPDFARFDFPVSNTKIYKNIVVIDSDRAFINVSSFYNSILVMP